MYAVTLLVEPEGGGQIQQIANTFGVDWPHLIAQAISFGIDRDEVLSKVFRGKGRKQHVALNGPFPAGSWASPPEASILPTASKAKTTMGSPDTPVSAGRASRRRADSADGRRGTRRARCRTAWGSWSRRAAIW